jgi:hypothetical protein
MQTVGDGVVENLTSEWETDYLNFSKHLLCRTAAKDGSQGPLPWSVTSVNKSCKRSRQ